MHDYLNGCRRKIQLLDFDHDFCRTYAGLVYHTNIDEYARREQNNPAALIVQNTCGKMAELGAELFFEEVGIAVAESPDFGIYAPGEKSFSSDIRVDCNGISIGCHVKSQSIEQRRRYGASWLFQKHKDPLITKPEQHKNDLLVFVEVDGLFVEILGFVWAAEAVLCLKEPVKEVLRKTKAALYLDDLRGAGLL